MAKDNKEHEFEEDLGPENGNESGSEKNIVDTVWKLFSSMKLGIILLIILALASTWGTIVVPKDEFGNPVYQQTYNSLWFRALLFLLMMNLLICSLNRWKFIKRSLGTPKIKVGENFLKRLNNFKSYKRNESVDNVVKEVESAIRSKGYRVFTEQDGDKTFIAADKGRHGVLGSFITHLAFLLIPLAAIYGSYTGFEGFAMIPEGDSIKISEAVTESAHGEGRYNVQVDPGSDFEVRVDKFKVDYYPTGEPKQYYSTLTILDNGKEIKTKTIYVNDPLEYKGVKLYQSSYQFFDNTKITAEAFAFEKAADSDAVEDKKDLVATSEKAEFTIQTGSYAKVPNTDLIVQIYQFIPDFDPMNPQHSKSNEPNNPAIIYVLWKGNQQVTQPDYALLNKPVTFEDTAIAFNDFEVKQGAATGLSIRKDPGVWFVWLGSTILLIGMFISYFLQHRKVWAVITKLDKITMIDIGGTTEKNKLAFEKDFEFITGRLDAN